ncbi:MAG: nucleotidyltransferase [Planctomycetes bacterium]|nr:nucleotidyltransferase [Planctomycetota bacterium]
MATTITSGFTKLRENLEITTLQSGTVSTRQKNVRDAVESEMSVLSSFLTGSYQRSTMIAPLGEADVDVFVVMASKYYEADGQASLLDKVKRALKKTYPDTPSISRNGQAVTITFSDFKVDVVPGFNRANGGYLIPDSVLKRWIETDPTKHVELWTETNKTHSGQFVPLVKMLKGWNKKNGVPFRSFHLEALARQVFTGVTISSYPSGVRYFFDKARDWIKVKLYDPAGYGGDIGAYLDTTIKMDDAVSRLNTAYDRAKAGEEWEAAGRTEKAFERWRMVFDTYFPAYG